MTDDLQQAIECLQRYQQSTDPGLRHDEALIRAATEIGAAQAYRDAAADILGEDA